MKKSIHWLLLLVSAVLLYTKQQGGFAISVAEQEKEDITDCSFRQQYQFTTARPGNISSAENRVSHQNTNLGSGKTETDEKRRQQQILHILSFFEYSCARSSIHNTHKSHRRQPHFYSITKENHQFRL